MNKIRIKMMFDGRQVYGHAKDVKNLKYSKTFFMLSKKGENQQTEICKPYSNKNENENKT